MNLVDRIVEWLDPKPKRDPKLDRVLAVTSATQQRRDRSHASLMALLREDERHEPERRNGHAD